LEVEGKSLVSVFKIYLKE
jgi:hypothetical protein